MGKFRVNEKDVARIARQIAAGDKGLSAMDERVPGLQPTILCCRTGRTS